MRQAVGTTTILKMVLAFTLLFSAFLAVAIVYNKAYKLKNEALSILEKYEGSSEAYGLINNYLKNSGYNTMDYCKDDETGISSLDRDSITHASEGNKSYYCISYECSNGNCRIGNNNKIYYNFRLFFKFNLPFFGDIFTFSVTGKTKGIKLYSELQTIGN